MKISKKYPQFENEEALIVVCEKQEAKIFSAKDGFISKLEDFRIEPPKYSDKEGFFKTRTKSLGVIRTGSVC